MLKHKNSLNELVEFHEHNLFLPTRTIYFGGKDWNEESDLVTSKTVSEVIKNLHILEYRETAPISIILNTVGGSWEDGIAVYDMIKSLKSPVTIIGMGKVYSMGSVILQAGKQRVMTYNTCMLIHDGFEGFVGDSKSFERWAEFSKSTREIMYKIYYERMKVKNKRITLKQIEELCSHDTIYTANDAIRIGLADNIIEGISKNE